MDCHKKSKEQFESVPTKRIDEGACAIIDSLELKDDELIDSELQLQIEFACWAQAHPETWGLGSPHQPWMVFLHRKGYVRIGVGGAVYLLKVPERYQSERLNDDEKWTRCSINKEEQFVLPKDDSLCFTLLDVQPCSSRSENFTVDWESSTTEMGNVGCGAKPCDHECNFGPNSGIKRKHMSKGDVDSCVECQWLPELLKTTLPTYQLQDEGLNADSTLFNVIDVLNKFAAGYRSGAPGGLPVVKKRRGTPPMIRRHFLKRKLFKLPVITSEWVETKAQEASSACQIAADAVLEASKAGAQMLMDSFSTVRDSQLNHSLERQSQSTEATLTRAFGSWEYDEISNSRKRGRSSLVDDVWVWSREGVAQWSTFKKAAIAEGDILQWCNITGVSSVLWIELKLRLNEFLENERVASSIGISLRHPLKISLSGNIMNDVNVQVAQDGGGGAPSLGRDFLLPHICKQFLEDVRATRACWHENVFIALLQDVVRYLAALTSVCMVCMKPHGLEAPWPRICKGLLCEARLEAWTATVSRPEEEFKPREPSCEEFEEQLAEIRESLQRQYPESECNKRELRRLLCSRDVDVDDLLAYRELIDALALAIAAAATSNTTSR